MPRKPSRRPTQPNTRSGVIPASRFKATCLAVMAQVQRTGKSVTITRHGAPIVRIVPAVTMDARPLFGRAKDTVRITGDVLAPLDVQWDVVPSRDL